MTSEEKKREVKEFCNQYRWLKCVYDDYSALYDKGPERIELLKEVASEFFCRLSLVFVQFMEMRMCALTDDPGGGQRENLTVKYILDLVGPRARQELELDQLSEQIHAIRPYIIKGRNKAIGHLDRKALLSKAVFGEYPRELWDQFWESLGYFVDKVHEHYFGHILGDAVSTRGAKGLVGALKKAVHYDDYFKGKGIEKLEEHQKMRYKDA